MANIKYWKLGFLLLFSFHLFAFQSTENVRIKTIDSLIDISWEIKQTNISQSLLLAKKAALLSDDINYVKGQQNALKTLAVLDIFRANYDSALIKSDQFLELTKTSKDTAEMANAYNVIGSIYYHKGEPELGIKNYLRSLKLKESLGDLRGTGKLYNNISTIYIGQEKYEKSIEYSLESIKIKRQLNDSIGLATSYNNIGFAYREREMYDSALFYSSLGLSIIIPSDNELLKSSLYSNTGDVYLQLGVLDSALYMFTKSIEISTKLQENRTIIYAYLGIGKVYAAQGEYLLALPFLEKSNRLAIANDAKKEIADSYYELSEAKASLFLYKEAFEDRKDYETYKDAVINEKNNKDIEQLERSYKYEKQQSQIQQFEIENEFQEDIFRRQRKIGLVLMTLLLLMALLAYFLVKGNKAKRIAIDDLELKNQEIKKQQMNIKAQNELLNEKNKRLLQLDEEKNHLVSVVAHDLRSPLANIVGLAGIISLDNENLTMEQKSFVEKINESADKLNEMISKVLSRDNVEHAELNVDLISSNIQPVIINSIEGLQQNATGKAINIYFDKHEALPDVIFDRNLALQVLNNLISNAIKFSPPSQDVYIKTSVQDEFVAVHIIDEGPGLTEEDEKSLFGRYQRLSAKPTGGESSTGLGLSIVKQYTELMGGVISYSNNSIKGADFVIKFRRP